MGATYTIADYMGPFLVCTLGSMLVMSVLCVFLVHKLAKKLQRFWIAYVPLLGYILFLYLLILFAAPVLEQTGDLLVPSEYEMMTTAGKIDNVTPAEQVPLYYINGEIRGADHIVIGEVSYYVISENLLTEGMLVELQYAHFENNVILSWQEVSADRVAIVQKEQLNASSTTKTEPPQKEIPQETQKISHVLFILGFVGFLALIGVTNLLHHRIVNFLFAKDGAVYGQIIPNRIAPSFTIIPQLVFFSMIIVGLSMRSGEYHGLLLFIIGGGAIVTILFVEQFTYLKLDGQQILISKLWKEKQYCTADICSVTWKSCRGMIGKQLVIIFNDGKSYWFNMDHYMGVQNTYNELKKYLDDSLNDAPSVIQGP